MVTREEFQRYRKVQDSGRFNMIAEAGAAARAAGLSRDAYLEIIQRYEELGAQFEDPCPPPESPPQPNASARPELIIHLKPIRVPADVVRRCRLGVNADIREDLVTCPWLVVDAVRDCLSWQAIEALIERVEVVEGGPHA